MKIEKDLEEKTLNINSKNAEKLIEIPIGISGTLANFTSVYGKPFLKRHGLKIVSVEIRPNIFLGLGTKYLNLVHLDGLTVVGDANTIFTYLGNSHWEVGMKK